jgi:hypothetical protein
VLQIAAPRAVDQARFIEIDSNYAVSLACDGEAHHGTVGNVCHCARTVYVIDSLFVL